MEGVFESEGPLWKLFFCPNGFLQQSEGATHVCSGHIQVSLHRDAAISTLVCYQNRMAPQQCGGVMRCSSVCAVR